MQVTVNWKRFDNFFRLYDQVKDVAKLVYVIGETHHLYIGSVGCKRGAGGLAVRYESQYIERAKAIFGADYPESQPAFAGCFDDNVAADVVAIVEQAIQWDFLTMHHSQALFRKHPYTRPRIDLVHGGTPPAFLCSPESARDARENIFTKGASAS